MSPNVRSWIVLLCVMLAIAITVLIAALYIAREIMFEVVYPGPCRVCEDIRNRTDYGRVEEPFKVTQSLATAVCWGGRSNGHWGGFTPLRAAAKFADYEAMRAILDAGADPEMEFFDELGGRMYKTTLITLIESERSSIRQRTEKCAALLLDRGAWVEDRDWRGRVALHYAIKSIEITKLLIDHGAQLNVCDQNGETPLHLAARLRQSEPAIVVARLLIDAGADFTIKNMDGQTPIALCEDSEMRAALKRAIDSRSNTPAAPSAINEGTRLCNAFAARDKSSFLRLLDEGHDPNEASTKGESVVHLAADVEDSFWLDNSLKRGGNANVENIRNRKTPIYYAIRSGNISNVQTLIDSGADVNHTDAYGSTPFLGAILRGCYDIAAVLVNSGADPRHVMPNGATALNYTDVLCLGPPDEDRRRVQEHLRLRTLLKGRGYMTGGECVRPHLVP